MPPLHDSSPQSAQRTGTIFLEEARVLSQDACPGGQHVLRLQAPKTAADAAPGMFAHLQCHSLLPMRRPMSLMRVNPQVGWIEILYKAQGVGTRLLTQRAPGETVSLLGPIGVPFKLQGYRRRALLIGGGVGIPPMIYLAEHLKAAAPEVSTLVVMGSEVPFPFQAIPSRILVPGVPAPVIAAMPLLEDWGIPSRLASRQGFPGCFDGYVTDLARFWLSSLLSHPLHEVELFACGPTPMLQAVAELAREYALPCQLSVEEYIACGVGGCAGCTVAVRTPSGQAMKRVCVDGPVFEASELVFRELR
ncbi:MAG: dihydroorotate dehydrogenase electron transfer subunit [Gammaproteobacteria bacterium]